MLLRWYMGQNSDFDRDGWISGDIQASVERAGGYVEERVCASMN